MFTPQKEGAFLALTSIRGEKGVPAFLSILKSGKGVIHDRDKGKEKMVSEDPDSIPSDVINCDRMDGNVVEWNRGEVWRSFEGGDFLDENAVRINYREALVRRICELEKELSEYQYHMGLLLIEKKEWGSKYEKLRQKQVESMETQKKMQTSHSNTVNKLNLQEQSLRKALDLQKQSCADLVKALNEMHAENAEVKLQYNNKLAEVRDMEASIQEKELQVRRRLHLLDANLAEASRRTSEINRRLVDVEADECKLHKSSSSFIIAKSNHDKDLAQQRKDLQNWEQELLEHQRRLVKRQIILDDREADANIKENIQKKKVQNLEETWKSWEMANSTLEMREENIDTRLKSLDDKEKVGFQKLIGDDCSILKSQGEELEIEMEMKRRKIDEECKEKLSVLAIKETKIEQREVEISKKEQTKEVEMTKEKGEIEKSRNSLEEFLTEENENIKHEKEKRATEYKMLDEKRLALEADLKHLAEEKERFEKWIHAEDDRLSKEKLAMTSCVTMLEDNGLDCFDIVGNSNGSMNLESKVQEGSLRSGKLHYLLQNDTGISQGLENQLAYSGNDSLSHQDQLPKTYRSGGFTVTDTVPNVVLSCRRNKGASMSGETSELSPQSADPSVILEGILPWNKKCARSLNFGSVRVTHQPSEFDTFKSFSDVGPDVESSGQKGNVEADFMLLVTDNSNNVPANAVHCNTKSKHTNKIDHHEGHVSPNSNCCSDISRQQADDGKRSSLSSPSRWNDMQEICPEIHSELSKKRRHKVRSNNVRVKKSRSVNALVQNTSDILEEYSQKEDSEELTRLAKDVNHEDFLRKSCHLNQDFTALSSPEKMPISDASVKIAVELNRQDAEVNIGKAEGHDANMPTQDCGERPKDSSGTDVSGLRRYNFRRSTLVQSGAVAQKLANRTKRKKQGKSTGSRE